MLTPPEIYALIDDFIAGRVAACELEEGLAPYEQPILLHEHNDPDLVRAVRLIGAGMADMDNGQSESVTRAFLRRRLGKILRTHLVAPRRSSTASTIPDRR